MKKMFKNKLIPMVIALVLCLSASIGFALAYFSDYEEAAGGATLHLGGRTELDEGDKTDAKHIVIKNTGDEAGLQTDMIVRVAIFGDEYMQPLDFNGHADDWYKPEGDEFYYYKHILKPGESTPEITATVKTSWGEGETEPPFDFEVTVLHEGAQAVYNGDTLKTPQGWNKDAVSEIEIEPITKKEVN